MVEPLIEDVRKAIAELSESGQDGQQLNLQELAGKPVESTKVHAGLAFAINSLFYCKCETWLFKCHFERVYRLDINDQN